MKVYIPFLKQFEDVLVNGEKTWTTRVRQYGKTGDTFVAFGATFVLDKIEWLPLKVVATHWKEEGCESYTDFLEVWCKIHPRIGFIPDAVYCVHVFHKLLDEVTNQK